ncbi:NAD kinase [Weissella thailandensis]|uniref:NAD kinase n=1 Tax=Weissella thailandensis TaxID=89061 RepID=A0ABX9I4R1_9LACO|nr:NAD kinase [Weissella thailandensis]NKY89939.1 NAD kinase [Weissella thailandensis]RDS59691.1 NAD kinase [Weissella thailandensis]GEP74250.1 NAD kinase [Weissella thailandensis]
MKIAVYSNNVPHSRAVVSLLKEKLIARSEGRVIFDNEKPEVVITVGGDGTLLGAFHHYTDQLDTIRFIGVHTGHLGFYADWQYFELDELVESLVNQETTPKTVKYPLLHAKIHYTDGHEENVLALNEAAIKRPLGTLVADVYIQNELFERFRGDGLTASTPTGSTAYNKAIGGAVMHPSLQAIQLAEIASINSRVFRTLGSPLIIGNHEVIKVQLENDGSAVTFSYDHLNKISSNIDWISFQVADQKIQFAEYRHMHFWHRVQSSFIGTEVR